MRAISAVAAAVVLVLVAPIHGRAAGDPYTPGQHGYDVSWPQCGHPAPRSGSFAIIGVNGGQPFTVNRCLKQQYDDAPRSVAPSLYLNTGYVDSDRHLVTAGCRALAAPVSGTSAERQAWAVGCSEAETSIDHAYSAGASTVAMWWLDVEILNRWSSNRAINRFAIQGMVTRLAQTGVPVGIYSSLPMWIVITGTFAAPGNLSAEWNAAGSCHDGFSPFARAPVWLAQHVSSNLDHDYAC